MFIFDENPYIKRLVALALEEDLAWGDVSTDPLAAHWQKKHGNMKQAKANVVARETCVVSGLPVVQAVLTAIDPTIKCDFKVQTGQTLSVGEVLASLQGSAASLLRAERLLLNFLQHLCGVATQTQRFMQAIAPSPCRVVHTRKTTPGLRFLEIQAVLDGGGFAHRANLGAAAMLKDNHWQAFCSEEADTGLEEAVTCIRARLSHTQTLTIEADTLAQARRAVLAGADVVLLDNFTLKQLQQAVLEFKGKTLLEASGGVTLKTVKAIAETGVDIISTSQLTLGAPAIDIALDFI